MTPAGMRRDSRGPALVYSALTLILVLLIASLAFTARQPPPPQIAELTPQAQHQITKAPTQLGSAQGSATGGQCTGSGPCGLGSGPGGGSGTTLPPTTLPPTTVAINEAAVHHCFGNPPMQIGFDTQSPPCIAYWAGNNGGATSRGVTGTQVNLVTFYNGGDSTIAARVRSDLQEFFNRYFEFYGRQINIQLGTFSGGQGCASVEAATDGVVKKYQPFAMDHASTNSGPCFDIEAARDHVVVMGESAYTQQLMQSFSPYLWSYEMDYANEERAVGKFACEELGHADARYSPDPTIASTPRKYGLIFEQDETPYPMVSTYLKNQLATCGITIAQEEDWENPENNNADYQLATFSSNAVTAMKNAGVTTTFCVCGVVASEAITAAASDQDYYPEWIEFLGDEEWNDLVKLYWPNADQRKALMGVTFMPRQLPYPDMTVNQALAMVDPGFQVNADAIDLIDAQTFYWSLLEECSGIQMAGPDLTPETFQRGLQATNFPNPFSPALEGKVGFGGGSHTMTVDATATWWSDSTPDPYPDGGSGTWCYMDGGERFSADSWPWKTPQPLFTGSCTS